MGRHHIDRHRFGQCGRQARRARAPARAGTAAPPVLAAATRTEPMTARAAGPQPRPVARAAPVRAEWLRVHGYLKRDRHTLAAGSGGLPAGRPAGRHPAAHHRGLAAARAGPAGPAPAGIPARAAPPPVPDVALLAPGALPERADGTRYRHYAEVIAALAAPAVFENRPDLPAAGRPGWRAATPALGFTGGRFFDGVNIGGRPARYAAAHRLGRSSTAAAYPSGGVRLPYRARRPGRLARRCAPLASAR